MGKKERQWQDSKYVLGYFGKRLGEARKRYLTYIKEGIDQGRRPDLVGGGQGTEDRGQMTEDGGQMTEGKGRKLGMNRMNAPMKCATL